jgi:hypothetical protein
VDPGRTAKSGDVRDKDQQQVRIQHVNRGPCPTG